MSMLSRRCPKRICIRRATRPYSTALSPSPKIQTVPFALDQPTARTWLEYAASSKFGFGCLVLQATHNWFGWPRTSPIEEIAFKAVLLPCWKVDFSAKVDGSIDGVEMDLSLQSLDATFPGFEMEPLNKLPLTAPWEESPVPFDENEHTNQLGADVSVVPFSLTPRRLLDKLKSLPHARESEHGMAVDPSKIRPSLFAYYPLYLPIYLGEYTVNPSLWPQDEETRPRVTIAQMASTTSKAFAIYSSPPPGATEQVDGQEYGNWEPGGESISFGLGGIPKKHDERPDPEAMKKVVPRITALLKSVTEGSKTASEGLSSMLTSLLPSSNTATATATKASKEPDATWNDKRCMEYDPHAYANKVWIANESTLQSAESLLRSLADLPEGDGENGEDKVRTVVVSTKGIKLSDGKSLKDDLRRQIERARLISEHSKPTWLQEEDALRLDRARQKASRGR